MTRQARIRIERPQRCRQHAGQGTDGGWEETRQRSARPQQSYLVVSSQFLNRRSRRRERELGRRHNVLVRARSENPRKSQTGCSGTSPLGVIKFLLPRWPRIQGNPGPKMRCSLAALAAVAVAASVHPDLDSIDYSGAQVRSSTASFNTWSFKLVGDTAPRP